MYIISSRPSPRHLYRPRHCGRIRRAFARTRFRDGTTAAARILQFVGRLVGLFGVGQSAADHRLAVGGRNVGGRRERRAPSVAQRDAGAVAVPGGRLSTGHTQHHLSMCRIELGGSHHIARRTSASW